MSNEELAAKFSAMELKIEALAEENGRLKRGGAAGISHTNDHAFGNAALGGLVAARSVTIATRPVRDDPDGYPTAIYASIQRPHD